MRGRILRRAGVPLGEPEFTPPDQGQTLDWVLVLDDAERNYRPPSQRN